MLLVRLPIPIHRLRRLLLLLLLQRVLMLMLLGPPFPRETLALALQLALAADAGGLGAVVDGLLAEPGVAQRLLGGDALGRVVDEDAPQQVEKLLVEGRGGGDDVLESENQPK